jgi:hypothetical protein
VHRNDERQIMLRSLTLLATLLLAACTGEGDGYAGQQPNTAVARFVTGSDVSVVQVTVSDRRPVRNAELVGPDGAVLQAYSIDANRASAVQQPMYQPAIGIAGTGGFGGGYSTFGAGVGVILPLAGGYGAPGSAVVVSDQVQSTALIRLPDPLDYRRTWQDWKLRIQLGDAPDASFVMLQAPQPPA